jgi:amino acid adenylation domain-containing protein
MEPWAEPMNSNSAAFAEWLGRPLMMDVGSALCQHRFAAVVRRFGDAPAVVMGGEVVSYRELDERAERLAGHLVEAGVGPDRLVGILLDRSVDLVVAVLASWKAGGAFLALDVEAPRARLRAILAEAGPEIVVTHPTLRARVPDGVPVFVLDGPSSVGQAPVGQAPAGLPADRAAPDRIGPWPDSLAYVMYTSGSTGVPKGVAVSHRSLLTAYAGWEAGYRLTDEVRVHLQAAGFAFDVATGDLARALFSGGCLVLLSRPALLDPPALYALMREQGVHFVEMTPTLLRPLVAHLERTGQRLDFLRLLVIGGERWTMSDYRAMRRVVGPDVRVVNSYGVTEAAVDSTYCDVTDELLTGDGVAMGHPLSGTWCLMLDGGLTPVTDGAPGELYLAGAQLARGYLGSPDQTAARFLPAPDGPPGSRMYRTGDLVRRLPTGELVYLGRIDDQVKVRGVRLQLAEVDAVLGEHPRVRSAASVLHPIDGRPTLVAYVVPADDADPPTGPDLCRWAAARLPAAAVPVMVELLPVFPVNANGKLDRHRLPVPGRSRAATDPGAVGVVDGAGAAPGGSVARNRVEAALLSIWAELLDRPGIAVDDDFFAIGGDSLLAVELMQWVRDGLGTDLGVGELFERPTVAELAAAVGASGTGGAVEIRPDPGRYRARQAPGQYRLWLLSRTHPDSAAYHIPAVVGIGGPLRADLLGAALRALVRRHDALRTTFGMTDEGPIQRIRADDDLTVEAVDVSGSAYPDAAAARFRATFVRRPFDAAAGPVLRAALIRLGPTDHQLVLCVHHLVCDGWSLRIMLIELGELYSALVRDVPPVLAALPLRYLDFAEWHGHRLDSGACAGQLDYWRAELGGGPPSSELLAALPMGPPTEAPDPRRHTVRLGPDLAGALRGLSREQRTTLFTVLLSGWCTLIHRWSRLTDLVVGVPFGSRVVPGTEPLVGFFVNTVALRVRLTGETSFAELIDRVRAAAARSYANQDVPFDQVQRELRGERDGGPPFRLWFNLLGQPDPAPAMAGLATEILDPPVTDCLFDLNLYVVEEPDSMRVDLVYDGARLAEGYAAELLDQYTLLLRQVAAEPDRPIRLHSLVTPAAGAVLPAEDRPLSGSGTGGGLLDVLTYWIGRAPDRVAIRDGERELRYGELGRWMADTGRRLRAAGGRPGGIVGIYARRDAALVSALLAVLDAGAAFLVLDSAYPAGRLAAQLAQARPVALLDAAGGLPDELARLDLPVIRATAPPLDGDTAAAGDRGRPVLDGPPPPAGEPSDLAYLAFTSGSTGEPLAVLGGPAPIRHFLDWYVQRYQIDSTDRLAMLSGLAHDPLLRDAFVPLSVGATLCVPPPYLLHSPSELARWLAAEAVTVIHLTPALARLLAGAGRRLPALRLVALGGDQLHHRDVALLRRIAPRATVVNCYGTTETPQVISCHEIPPGTEPAGTGQRVPVGCGIEGVQLLVRSAAGAPAGIGEPGRIVVRSPYLASGYLDPARTSARFADDPEPGHRRYDTGDIGRYLPNGEVEVLGRDDEQVKVAGVRVEPAELENQLRRHEAVTDCVAVPHPDPSGNLGLVAYLVPAAGVTLDRAGLREWLARRLPGPLLPTALVSLPQLPLTPNGKVDRGALPPPDRAGHGPGTGQPATEPRTDLERVVARVWRDVLGLDEVGIDVPFFAVGGSSLLIAATQQILETELGRRVPVLAMFEYPTVRSLAAHLAGGADPSWAPRKASRRPAADGLLRRSVRHMIQREGVR